MDKITMIEAKAQGLIRYFTGKPCKRGHVAERMVSTRACRSCLSDFTKAWKAARPEQMNAAKRAYRNANLEKVKAWQSANQKKNRASANARNRRYAEAHRDELSVKGAVRRAANPEAEKARVLKWAKANPHRLAATAARRRAATLRATPAWADQRKLGRAYELCAEYRAKGIDCHVDHIVPLQGKTVSGLHVHYNLQIISAKANRTKSNRL